MASIDIGTLLKLSVEYGASDLHFVAGLPPMFRISGKLLPGQFDPLTGEDTKELLYALLTDDQKAKFEEEHELDFSVGIPDVSRFRVNLFMQKGSVGGVMRTIGNYIPTMEDLGLPEVLYQFARVPRGLILVTGPTGSGKSTTLAAMINQRNMEEEGHILTIEDPIEFIHPPQKCAVNQRELGTDTFSFAKALKGALRQDPDIVLVGEMRDLETISAALTIAETGHVVYSTLHTTDAAQTLDRIVDVFPPYQQEQIRVLVSVAVQGVVCQQLVPKADGAGRVAAREVLVMVPAVCNLVREGKTHQIYTAMQTGTQYGMITMDQSLANLVKSGDITLDVAKSKSSNPTELARLLK